MTAALEQALDAVMSLFDGLGPVAKGHVCAGKWGSSDSFDTDLAFENFQDIEHSCGNSFKCAGTVSICGQCYDQGELNYTLWGLLARLCPNESLDSAYRAVTAHRHTIRAASMIDWVLGGHHIEPLGITGRKHFTKRGFEYKRTKADKAKKDGTHLCYVMKDVPWWDGHSSLPPGSEPLAGTWLTEWIADGIPGQMIVSDEFMENFHAKSTRRDSCPLCMVGRTTRKFTGVLGVTLNKTLGLGSPHVYGPDEDGIGRWQ